MKLNKKGMSLIEIIVSLALIAIVIIFLMNLFINVRGVYNNSKIQADYDIISATIARSVGDDIEKYGLLSVEYIETAGDKSKVLLTFDAYRSSKLSERIQKVLKIYDNIDGDLFISYAYDPTITKNITGNERITNVARELPDDAILVTEEYINIRRLDTTAVEIKIPITNSKGTDYSINIYGMINN